MSPAVDRLLDAFHARQPIRAGSLIVTVFGDAIAPRGGQVALGPLLALLAAMRVGESPARTALSRLVAEGWLERRRTGRTGQYRLSDTGRDAFAAASARIYGVPDRAWDGRLHLALIEATGAPERARRRAALEAEGFGAVTPDLLVAPRPGGDSPCPSGDSPCPGGAAPALRLVATPLSEAEGRRLAARAWPLAALDARYRDFADGFAEARAGAASLTDPLDALVLRTLAIHAYRRVVLRDPGLPDALLPQRWAGREARATCAAIYRGTIGPAERWLDANAYDEAGPLPPADLADRFAG